MVVKASIWGSIRSIRILLEGPIKVAHYNPKYIKIKNVELWEAPKLTNVDCK
jgi:hypothetical protein